jgi:hypothetical protein
MVLNKSLNTLWFETCVRIRQDERQGKGPLYLSVCIIYYWALGCSIYIKYTEAFPTIGLILSQGCGSAFISSGSGILGRIPIRIQGFNDQKLKKITAGKKTKFFLIKNYNLLIPRPP